MYKWLAVGHKTRTLPALHTDWQYLGLWPMPNMAGMQLARPGPARLGSVRNGTEWHCLMLALWHICQQLLLQIYTYCAFYGIASGRIAEASSSIDLLLLACHASPLRSTPLRTSPPTNLPPLCASAPPLHPPGIHIRNDARSPKMHADHIIIAAPSLALRPRPTRSNTH